VGLAPDGELPFWATDFQFVLEHIRAGKSIIAEGERWTGYITD
jgi:hypothetical protein